MLDNLYPSDTGTAHEAGALQSICLFLEEHGAALEAAARLLGGTRWTRRVLTLRVEVRDGIRSRHACLKDLDALGRLLRLENVGDPEAEEFGYFAMLNPADPRVHDICLLCDKTHQLIGEVSQRQPVGMHRETVRT